MADQANRELIVTFHQGVATFVCDEELIPLLSHGQATRTRLSNVVPSGSPIRLLAFQALRWAFGDMGKVAAWTRLWRGPWEARMVATGEVLGPYQTRIEALAAERAWIREHLSL